MKTLAQALLLVLLPASALAEPLPAPLPRPLLVPLDGVDAAWASRAAWRSWRAGDASTAAPVALSETSHPDWRVAQVLDDSSASSAWIVLGEGEGRAVTLLARSGEVPVAAIEISPPRVRPAPEAGTIRLAWTAQDVPALAGWRLQRSQDGATWSDLGMKSAFDEGAVDAAPAGPWTWRLVPELQDGVLPAVESPASEVAWSSDGDLDDDGVADAVDRCRAFSDPAQADRDGDGISDACDFAWADLAPRGAPDGVVGVADVVLILRLAVGLDTPTPAEARAADVAPALIVQGMPDLATPRLLAPSAIAVDDAVLALRAAVGLAEIESAR